MKNRTGTWIVAMITAIGLSACSQSSRPAPTDNFSLSTHCGIYELTTEGRLFLRDGGRLTDGGNPPDGWDDPKQAGVLVVTGTRAVFTDSHGHRETFTERVGPKPSLPVCA